MQSEASIERHHIETKELLAKRLGRRKLDSRLRAVRSSLMVLLGNDQAYHALMAEPDDNGFPIGDNPDFILAIESVSAEFGGGHFDLHDLKTIQQRLKAYPDVRRAFALAVLG